MTASINEWAAPFLDGLRKFYYSEDFLLVYDNASGEFGVASTDAKLLYQGDNKFILLTILRDISQNFGIVQMFMIQQELNFITAKGFCGLLKKYVMDCICVLPHLLSKQKESQLQKML